MANGSDYIIKVNTEVLVSMSGEVEDKIQNLRKALERIDNTITSSGKYWEGEGFKSHLHTYRNKTAVIEKVLDRFQEHVADLKSIAGVYTQAERAVLSNNQELAVDQII